MYLLSRVSYRGFNSHISTFSKLWNTFTSEILCLNDALQPANNQLPHGHDKFLLFMLKNRAKYQVSII